MSHRWDCPTEWEARLQGERAQERGEGRWRNPHGDRWHDGSGCEDAESAWNRGYRDAERHEQERAEEARIERYRAEQLYQQESQEEQEYRQHCDAEYARMEADHYADLFEDHLIETVDLPRWADDGGYEP